jgi:hypothetical protein
MELELLRIDSQENVTIGGLYLLAPRKFLCFTLEDEARDVKVAGETRIPAGRYQIKLRTEGQFHQRYSMRFPSFHRGMLWLQDVPNFEYILIHIGNGGDDTAGCVLVGDTALPRVQQIGGSEVAYRRIYPPIAEVLLAGREAWITVREL